MVEFSSLYQEIQLGHSRCGSWVRALEMAQRTSLTDVPISSCTSLGALECCSDHYEEVVEHVSVGETAASGVHIGFRLISPFSSAK